MERIMTEKHPMEEQSSSNNSGLGPVDNEIKSAIQALSPGVELQKYEFQFVSGKIAFWPEFTARPNAIKDNLPYQSIEPLAWRDVTIEHRGRLSFALALMEKLCLVRDPSIPRAFYQAPR